MNYWWSLLCDQQIQSHFPMVPYWWSLCFFRFITMAPPMPHSGDQLKKTIVPDWQLALKKPCQSQSVKPYSDSILWESKHSAKTPFKWDEGMTMKVIVMMTRLHEHHKIHFFCILMQKIKQDKFSLILGKWKYFPGFHQLLRIKGSDHRIFSHKSWFKFIEKKIQRTIS